jgi:DNA-binding winged helix-turn-helix (wHTH) protein
MLVHRFGEFEFDLTSGRLFRGDVRVPLSEPQSAILVCLITNAGQVVPRDRLVQAGWNTQSVSDDNLKQLISRLRKALGAQVGTVIETVPSHGYRFTAPIERAERLRQEPALAHLELEPYRAFTKGRADLFTLGLASIRRAIAAFERTLRSDPNYAPAHVGLANAHALIYESSRVDAKWDVQSLLLGIEHARRAIELAPESGDAWSTLSLTLYLHGQIEEGAAAARKAVALEPDDWLHWLRFAFVSWGGDRIRAAGTVLKHYPDLALAYWLIVTVQIARGAFDVALDVLDKGCAAQDRQLTQHGSFPAVGLHLLRGLVLAARGDLEGSAQALTHELSYAEGQLYARECRSNTWYTLGAVRLRQRRREESEQAFANALQVAPAHVFTLAALGRTRAMLSNDRPRSPESSFADAIGLARSGRHADAAQAWQAAVTRCQVPHAGWILPVEPVINAAAHPDVWADALTTVRTRAV